MTNTIGKVIFGEDIMKDLTFVWQNTNDRAKHIFEIRIMSAVCMYLLAMTFIVLR